MVDRRSDLSLSSFAFLVAYVVSIMDSEGLEEKRKHAGGAI